MPFDRPTLTELIERAASDIEVQLPGLDARLRRSLIGVLTRMHAASMHALYGYVDFLARQITIITAEAEFLEDWAATWNITRKAAAQATGSVTFTGTNSTLVPQGTVVQRSDGTEFTTDADGTITSGSVSVAVTAVEGGADTDTAENSTVTLVTPISGVDSNATVDTGGLTGGTDIEDDDALRGRVLTFIQQPPQGGTSLDYENWALEVDGVTRVWVFPLYSGAGTVGVTFVLDDSSPIIPTGAKVTEVQNYIDALRPVTATVTVYAPTEQSLNLTIALTPDTAAVRSAVETELTDLLSRSGGPGQTIYLSQINEAISVAVGETDHDLVSPVADIVVTNSQIYTLGTITWQ